MGKKTKAEGWPQELKVNIPSGYDNVNLIWILVLTGLTRLLQIETDFMNGRALFPARARVAPSPPLGLAAGRTTGPRLGAASEADHGDGGR